MKTRSKLGFIAVAAALASTGCSVERPGEVQSASAAQAGAQTVELAATGVTTGQRGLHHANIVAFGQPRGQVLAQLRPALGVPTAQSRNADCPSGPVDTVSYGALDLHFEDGRFAGWVVDGSPPEVQTYLGLKVGEFRGAIGSEEAQSVVEGSTLGTELSVNGVGLILDGPGEDARITTLFAGVTCFAR